MENPEVTRLRRDVSALRETPFHERPVKALETLERAAGCLSDLDRRITAIEAAIGGLSSDVGQRKSKGLAEI